METQNPILSQIIPLPAASPPWATSMIFSLFKIIDILVVNSGVT
jgi:hypothetical protein